MAAPRTTKAELSALTRAVQDESTRLGIITPRDRLTLHTGIASQGIPFRLRLNGSRAFEPADGNHGDIGRTAREAEHTLRIMWATMRAARKAHDHR